MPGQPVSDPAGGFAHPRAHRGGDDRNIARRRVYRAAGDEIHLVEAAFVADWSLVQVPDAPNKGYEFLDAQGGGAGIGDAVPVAHHPFGAVADAEHDATAGQFVEIARLGRQDQRAASDAVENRRPDATPVSRGGHCRHRDGSRPGIELRCPHRVEPGLVGRGGGDLHRGKVRG